MPVNTFWEDTSISFIPIQNQINLIKIDLGHMRREEDKLLVKDIDQLSKEYPSNDSNIKSWHSGWWTHVELDNVVNNLMKDISKIFLNDHIVDILFPFLAKKTFSVNTVYLKSSWLSLQNKGEWVNEHIHSIFPHLCFCYYINVEENASPFVATSYLNNNVTNTSTCVNKPIYPKNGELLLFPPNLYHSVPITEGKRYTFAGNFLIHQSDVIIDDGGKSIPISNYLKEENE